MYKNTPIESQSPSYTAPGTTFSEGQKEFLALAARRGVSEELFGQHVLNFSFFHQELLMFMPFRV